MNTSLPDNNSKDDSPIGFAAPLANASENEIVVLPEPDTDNITVLSHNLPNKPILPWNRYDSLWDETKTDEIKTSQDEETETEGTSEVEPDEMD
jgi:hypothetical protein